MAYPLSKLDVTLGWGLRHEVSSRHNGRRLFLSCMIRLHLNKNVLVSFDPNTSRVYFSDVVIRPLCFLYANGGVPATLFLSGGVSATPVQIYFISDTPIQTFGVSATHVQSGGVSALTRTNAVIGFSLRQSTFYSSVYTAEKFWSTCLDSGFMSNPKNFMPKLNIFTPNSKIPSLILVWV